MSEFIDIFNEKLDNIKLGINKVYEKTKEQYSKQKNKSFTSYMELTHVYPKRKNYEDDFQDMTKIESEDSVIFDPDGYTLAYKVEDKKFKKDYYTKKIYPLTMIGGAVIPGSDFSDIFKNNIGFWGYQASNKTKAFFSLDFAEKEEINKVYLKSNNSMDITLYIKEDFNKDWVEIGTRSGARHVWNFTPIDCVSLKFISNTNLFSVSRLQAGLARYNKNGALVSNYYEIQNLYRLKFETNDDIPENTDLDFFIRVSGQPDLYLIEDETIITGGVDWDINTDDNILPSGYIEDSLTVKVGYNQWEIIDTYDWKWEKNSLPLNADDGSGLPYGNFTGVLDFSDLPDHKYKILQDSLHKVKLGETGTEFVKDVDYSVEYDLNAKTITVKKLDGSSIPDPQIINLKCTVLYRKKVSIKQIRAYVNLENAQDIILQDFPAIDADTYFKVRHVVARNEIIKDITQEINNNNKSIFIVKVPYDPENPATGTDSYIIKGLEGLNLIEIEFLDATDPENIIKYLPGEPDPPEQSDLPILKNVDYFSRKYALEKVLENPQDGEYMVQPFGSLYEVVAYPSGGLWLNYAETIFPSGLSYIQLETRFISTDGKNAPTLRGYNIENYNV